MTELLPDRVIDEARFRRALGLHAAGVVVVTAASGDGPAGLTATSFSSVSLSPPLVSFYVARTSTTWPSMGDAGRFAVNILASAQADLAARFAQRGVDRFAAPTGWRPDADGTPLLDGVCAHLLCALHATLDLGDHTLVVGRVTGISIRESGRPLLYHRGRFGDFRPQGR
ncbi:flavin reductase family protein [Thermomonospora umbrina]|uniref:Flavin reductase (DIM6/NTAB) family NADH-FMN oxidoreductase RutF n=1 Tax=Thermomonospora umbrina TaxID=111806 RepID=A0A3D9SZY1_9ACTN|nr:flavin reductase family protein [Thermomonospora umbrina]REF00111.1 flavin reductase (DIM6/NTAB) family NADH-FMN oxidoreductase RutF [Thermomonospora umbrina]